MIFLNWPKRPSEKNNIFHLYCLQLETAEKHSKINDLHTMVIYTQRNMKKLEVYLSDDETLHETVRFKHKKEAVVKRTP